MSSVPLEFEETAVLRPRVTAEAGLEFAEGCGWRHGTVRRRDEDAVDGLGMGTRGEAWLGVRRRCGSMPE